MYSNVKKKKKKKKKKSNDRPMMKVHIVIIIDGITYDVITIDYGIHGQLLTFVYHVIQVFIIVNCVVTCIQML